MHADSTRRIAPTRACACNINCITLPPTNITARPRASSLSSRAFPFPSFFSFRLQPLLFCSISFFLLSCHPRSPSSLPIHTLWRTMAIPFRAGCGPASLPAKTLRRRYALRLPLCALLRLRLRAPRARSIFPWLRLHPRAPRLAPRRVRITRTALTHRPVSTRQWT